MLRAIGAAVLLASAGMLGWPPGAGAEAPQAKGWWYYPQQAGSPIAVPAPPTVPPEGLYVAQGPGAQNVAMAALEYPVTGVGSATLKLTFAPGGAGTAAITACPASNGFTPGPAQAWADAPAYNCTAASADGVLAADAATMAFTLTPDFVTAGGTAMQMVLIPAPGSDPFQVPIADPGSDSFAGPAPLSDPTSSVDVPSETAADVPFDESFGSESILPSVSDGLGLGGAVGDAPTAAPAQAQRGGRPERAAPRPVAAVQPMGDRVAAVIALGVIGAGLWWLGGRPVPTPRLIGGASVEGEVVRPGVAPAVIRHGGIGRFARPRSAAPNRL